LIVVIGFLVSYFTVLNMPTLSTLLAMPSLLILYQVSLFKAMKLFFTLFPFYKRFRNKTRVDKVREEEESASYAKIEKQTSLLL
jgi:hypothetical protein